LTITGGGGRFTTVTVNVTTLTVPIQ
jgi:hypothetical protein